MDIKRRVKTLEEKCRPQEQPSTRYREYFELVMGDPELRELVVQLAEQQAGLREADPDLLRRCAAKFEEVKNRREAEGRLH